MTYNNVVFRFYPGDGMNNYNIERNYHYVMKVTLVGIDISDERITVNEIPPIEVDPGKMPAEKGGMKEVQITARPGQAWSFDLEEWLSAMIGGVAAGTGVTVSHQGPAMVTFQSVSANPKVEDRSVTFSVNVNGENQEITITQEGSALSKGSDVISLGAAEGSEGASSFTTTKGLPWLAALSGENWWNWADDNPAFSGDEATGTEQALKIKATASNPLASERSGKITVSAGTSIAEIGYTGLKEEIVVKQAGSRVEGSSMEVNPEAANNQTSSFVATSGLDWVAKVTEGDWITLVGATSGSQTTGKAQNVTFNIAVNPFSSARSGEIVVRAGDEIGGPTGTIKVNQKASALTVSASPTTLAATKDAAGTLSFKGTSGLSFSITKPDWLTLTGTIPETTNGNDQNLGYKTSEVNLNGSERTATVMVKAGIMSKEVTIKQVGSIFDVTGGTGIIAASGGTTTGSVTATDGLAWTISPVTDNGITVNPTNGSGNARLEFSANENNAAERTGTFIVTVTDSDPLRTVTVTVTQAMKNIPVCIDNLQIQKSDPGTIAFADVASFCEDLNEEKHDDWRLPTKDELVIIYNNLASLEEYVGAGFVMLNDGGYNNKWFWSSDFYNKNRYVVNMITGRVSSSTAPTGGGYIRCVRDNY